MYLRKYAAYLGCCFQKNEYFWGMKILWIFFGVVTKLDYIKGSFLCIFWELFFRWRYRKGDFFGAATIFQIFFGGA